MRLLTQLFGLVHAAIAALFAAAALTLLAIAARMGWQAVLQGFGLEAGQSIIEAIGILAAAVVALQIAETIVEEEVIRDADISAPTRVRRFLSRFFVVTVVALAIEGLVATFHAVHQDLAQLQYAAALLASVGVLLAAWGVFIHLNRSAEELEPDAMEDAKNEDHKLKEMTAP
jgi:Ni/Fe-hydrogenase subunit HybB-like protein